MESLQEVLFVSECIFIFLFMHHTTHGGCVGVLFFPFTRWVGQSDILGMELKDGESCGMAKKLVRWEVFVIRSDAMQPASLGN